MNTKRLALLAPLSAALMLAACGGGDRDSSSADEGQMTAPATNVEEVGAPVNMTDVPVEAPPAARIDNSGSEAMPPEPAIAPDEQTQDDAAATGMTARVSRDETANDTGQVAE